MTESIAKTLCRSLLSTINMLAFTCVIHAGNGIHNGNGSGSQRRLLSPHHVTPLQCTRSRHGSLPPG